MSGSVTAPWHDWLGELDEAHTMGPVFSEPYWPQQSGRNLPAPLRRIYDGLGQDIFRDSDILDAKVADVSRSGAGPDQFTGLVFQRSGGLFVALGYQMTISSSGQVSGRSQQAQLDNITLTTLVIALRNAHITANARYDAPQTICDGFQYSLSYRGHAVSWDDTAVLPTAMNKVAHILQRLSFLLGPDPAYAQRPLSAG